MQGPHVGLSAQALWVVPVEIVGETRQCRQLAEHEPAQARRQRGARVVPGIGGVGPRELCGCGRRSLQIERCRSELLSGGEEWPELRIGVEDDQRLPGHFRCDILRESNDFVRIHADASAMAVTIESSMAISKVVGTAASSLQPV